MTENFNDYQADPSELVYSQSVLEFVAVSNEFCKFLEQSANESKHDFINKAHKLLAFLYLKASLLPKVENVFEDVAEKFVSEQDWEYVKAAIAQKLVSHDTYIELPDPVYPDSDNSTSQSLSECFADTYQDLKDFTTAYNIGSVETMHDSLCEVKNNFESYWGQRVLAIINNFHLLVFGVDELSDEEDYQARSESFGSDNWFTREILNGEGIDE